MQLYAQKRRALARLAMRFRLAPHDIAEAWRTLHEHGFLCALAFVLARAQ